MVNKHDVEEIILCMADIVMENRDLRYAVNRLRKIREEHEEYIRDTVRNSEQANRELLKMILEHSLTGGNIND